MAQLFSCLLVLFLASQVQASPTQEEGAPAAASTREAPAAAESATPQARNRKLIKQHTEIWELMELSQKAMKELNGVVVSVNTHIHKNKIEHPAAFKKAVTVKRTDKPLTYEDYIASHTRRFKLLKISQPTQTELLGALEFMWKALRDPNIPEEKRKVAETIRDMMKSMGGPPPCCDDNIFKRAGMAN